MLGAGVAGLVAAYRLTQAGHVCDVYERWPGLGGQAATLGCRRRRAARALLPPSVHERPPHRVALRGARDGRRARVARLVDGVLRRRAPVGVQRGAGSAALPAAAVALARSHGPRGAAPAEARARGGAVRVDHRARVDRVAHGARAVAQDLGAAAARQVRRARRGHLDGMAVEQAHAAPPARGRRGAPGAARLPEALVGAVVRRAARRDRGGWRARPDRLPGGGAVARRSRSSSCRRARAARSAVATIRAGSRSPARRLRARRRTRARRRLRARRQTLARRPRPASATTPWSRRSRTTSSSACSTTTLPGRSALRTSTACARPSTTRRSASCSSSTAASRRSTGRTSPTRQVPFVGLIEHTNFIDPKRYGGRRFLYVANYLAPGDPLLDLSQDELLDAYVPGPARRPARLLPGLDRQAAGCTASRPRSRSSRSATTSASRRFTPASPNLVLANTTQIYPEDRGTNYSVRLGGDAARALLAGRRPAGA